MLHPTDVLRYLGDAAWVGGIVDVDLGVLDAAYALVPGSIDVFYHRLPGFRSHEILHAPTIRGISDSGLDAGGEIGEIIRVDDGTALLLRKLFHLLALNGVQLLGIEADFTAADDLTIRAQDVDDFTLGELALHVGNADGEQRGACLLYTSPSPRD